MVLVFFIYNRPDSRSGHSLKLKNNLQLRVYANYLQSKRFKGTLKKVITLSQSKNVRKELMKEDATSLWKIFGSFS